MSKNTNSKQNRHSDQLKDEVKHDLNYPKREDEVIVQNLKTHRLQKGEIRGHSAKSK